MAPYREVHHGTSPTPLGSREYGKHSAGPPVELEPWRAVKNGMLRLESCTKVPRSAV